mgnify:CR=1 FL=1
MYYLIGIKGAGMSALAIILKQLGYDVMGSDLDKHFFTEKGLIDNDIPFYAYDENNIKEGYKIIKGLSIKDDNPEVKMAKKLGLEIVNYNEMVGELTRKFKTITVAGCHGKTTTTAMITHVLNPLLGVNYLIGDGTGGAKKDNEFFVLEACEYCRHFLLYKPYYAVITNIDLDHVDYFKDIDDVISAYREYADMASKLVIACGDDVNVRKMKTKKKIVYFGINEGNDVRAVNIKYTEKGIIFDVVTYDKFYGHFDLPLFGLHQLLDALACISVCYFENIDSKKLQEVFKSFEGAKRRFTETIINDSVIIDDYAHHPSEVEAVINACNQKYHDKKKIIIFQPHTFSRTKEFAEDLIKEFKKVDEVFLLDIHPAREKQEDFPGITSDIIISKLPNGHLLNKDNVKCLSNYKNSVFMFMSPNDVSYYEEELKKMQ